MMIDSFSLFCGVAAGLVAGLAGGLLFSGARMAVLRDRLRQQEDGHAAAQAAMQAAMQNSFAAAAQEALVRNSEHFMTLAQEKLKQAQADGSFDMEKRQKALTDLVNPIQKNLETLGSTLEQLKGTDQALRQDLQLLNRETARLVGALKDPAGQGRWGEFILEGLLEKSGLLRGVHYETQVSMATESGRQRPDAIIHLQGGLHIVVDSKAPLNEFVDRLSETLSIEDTEILSANLARQVRTHIRDLGRKNYWENIESPDFTVLFLPSEHLFSMAVRTDPDMIDYASAQNVILASPTLLMSLLRVVSLGWRQASLAQNAQDISAQGAELYQRLAGFVDHFEKIGKGIAGALDNYNRAVGSLERMILPSARKLKDLHVQTGNKELGAPAPLDSAPRTLTAPELLQAPDGEAHNEKEEKKRA